MKKLIIIRGVSGSGKSTFAKTLAEAFKAQGLRAFKCEADDYFYESEDSDYKFDPTKLQLAHEWCQDCVEIAMEGGVEVVILSNTSTANWELEPYLKMAENFGYTVDCLVKENRHDGVNVHDVPEHVLERQRERLLKNLKL